MKLSTFRAVNDPHVVSVASGDWPTFVSGFASPQPETTPKASLPLWSPATYRDGHRDLDNIESVYALGYDVDEAPVPTRAELEAALTGVRALVHSSSRATKDAPRWRLVVAVSRPMTADEYKRAWRAFESLLPFRVGQAAKDPSRAWYASRRGAEGYYEVFDTTGEPVDVDALLAMTPAEERPEPKAPLEKTASPRKDRDAAAALLAAAWPGPGHRDVAQLNLAGALYHSGWPEADAVEFLCTVCRLAGNEERAKREKTVRRTYERGRAGGTVKGWASMAEHVGASAASAARALLDANARGAAELGAWLDKKKAPTETEPPTPEEPKTLPPFPVDVLPVALRDFVTAEAERTQTPPDLAGMLVLGCCAASVAGKVDVEVEPGYVEPLNLFIAVAMPPGERKSAVFSSVFAPLRAAEREAIESTKTARSMAEAKRDLAVNQLKKKKSQYAKLDEHTTEAAWAGTNQKGGATLALEIQELADKVDRMEVPPEPRYLCDDVTVEKLGVLLAEQKGRMCLASAEGSIFSIIGGRYAKDGKASFEVLLQAHAGDEIRIDRQSRDSVYVAHPRLTMCLAVQPSVIEGLGRSREMRGQGLLARFLYAFPESRVGSREARPAGMPEGVRLAWERLVGRLCSLPGGPDGTIRRVGLSPEAHALHVRFREDLEPRLVGDLTEIRDWASKLAGAVARLAAVMSLAEGHEQVSEQAMASAIAVARYLTLHAAHALGAIETTEAGADAAKVLGWLLGREGRRATLREVLRHGPGRALRNDRKRLQAALMLLTERGDVEQRDGAFVVA